MSSVCNSYLEEGEQTSVSAALNELNMAAIQLLIQASSDDTPRQSFDSASAKRTLDEANAPPAATSATVDSDEEFGIWYRTPTLTTTLTKNKKVKQKNKRPKAKAESSTKNNHELFQSKSQKRKLNQLAEIEAITDNKQETTTTPTMDATKIAESFKTPAMTACNKNQGHDQKKCILQLKNTPSRRETTPVHSNLYDFITPPQCKKIFLDSAKRKDESANSSNSSLTTTTISTSTTSKSTPKNNASKAREKIVLKTRKTAKKNDSRAAGSGRMDYMKAFLNNQQSQSEKSEKRKLSRL